MSEVFAKRDVASGLSVRLIPNCVPQISAQICAQSNLRVTPNLYASLR